MEIKITLRPDLFYWIFSHSWLILISIGFSLYGYDMPNGYIKFLLFLCAFSCIPFLAISYINLLYTKWVINNEKITIYKGFLIRDISYIEMYRIFDYQERKNIIQSFLGVTTYIIYSNDKTSPILNIKSVRKNDIDIIETIRLCVEMQKQEKPIYELIN